MSSTFRRKFRRHKGLDIRCSRSEILICFGAQRQGSLWIHAACQSDHANWHGNVRCYQGNGHDAENLNLMTAKSMEARAKKNVG